VNMFFNILINSVEAISDNKGKISISLFKEKESCLVEIKDTGCGISSENAGNIFEPFFTTKMAQKHAGLGLSLVQMIVDTHKGSVRFDSAAPHGVVIVVTLPLFEPAA
jgi:signal transduction histidine kinase